MSRDDVLVSRFVRRDDPTIEFFAYRPHRWRKALTWDLAAMAWWSRIYEYRWLLDAVDEYLGRHASRRTALDAGCGDGHPGCFMLAQSGFAHVDAMDVFERHPLIGERRRNLSYVQGDLGDLAGRSYDFVACLSTLEHVPPARQGAVLGALCTAVAPGGALALTFDFPGFEHDTDLELYAATLAEHGLAYNTADVPEDEVLTSRNGRVSYPGWPEMSRDELRCYRLFATRR